MTKQNTASPAVALPVLSACGNCGIEERRFLHYILHRGVFRRLCTTCVLKLHPQSFCPTCLLVYNPSPPSLNGLVSCVKCSSLSHSSCVGPTANAYVCPLCVITDSPFFNLKKGKDFRLIDDDDDDDDDDRVVIDKKAAKVLLTAAKISAGSMSKAASFARQEAEKRAKDAAFTRKRAREALEHVDYLLAREKIKKKDVPAPLVPLSNGGPVSLAVNNRGGGNQCRSMVVAAVPLEEENVGNNNVVDKLVDGSSEVLVALNAVHLKGQNPILGLPAVVNGSAMDVEANGGAVVSPTVQNHSGAMGSKDEKSSKLECRNGQSEMINGYEIISVDDDKDQHMGNFDGGEANGALPQQQR